MPHESLIPSNSPILAAVTGSGSHHHSRSRNSVDSFTLHSNQLNPDIPADLEFLAPGQWDEEFEGDNPADYDDGDDGDDGFDTSDHDDYFDHDTAQDTDVDDWSLEDGHVEGLPRSNLRLDPKCAPTPLWPATPP